MIHNETIEGYLTVGDSTSYDQNPKCHSAIYGQGYYTCDEALNGRYIAFYATGQYSTGTYDSTGLHVLQLKLFRSANLITTAALTTDIPLANMSSKSFSDNMSILNPRVTTTASNVPGGTCGQYTASQSDQYFTFTLPQYEYIETIHTVGEAYDFNYDMDSYGAWSPESTCTSGCTNMQWKKITAYGGPSTLSDADLLTNDYKCGKPSANKKLEMNGNGTNLNESQMNKMLRMGGVTACNWTSKFDTIKLHIVSDNVNTSQQIIICNIGIFTCPCTNYIAYRTATDTLVSSMEFDIDDSSTLAQTFSYTQPATKGTCMIPCSDQAMNLEVSGLADLA